MILIVDNYDSFVHNLARYVRLCGSATEVLRNDQVDVATCLALKPHGVVISPGPKGPADAGVSMPLIEALSPATPLLGVCLGHQCLVESFGGVVGRAKRPLHGEARPISHNGEGLFGGMVSPMPVGRYHSLIAHLPENGALDATAWSEDGEVMAAAHKTRPWFGVQFHPESLLTQDGDVIIRNFLRYCERGRAR